MSLPPLCLISDAQRVGEERFLWALREAINAGHRMVQVREPSWSVDQVRDLALKVRKIGEEEAMGSLVLITNRRSELVLELDLAGVHVGGGRPEGVASARALLGSSRLVGYSAHATEEIVEAAKKGADYASYSPVFEAISKRHPLPAVGLKGLEAATHLSPSRSTRWAESPQSTPPPFAAPGPVGPP